MPRKWVLISARFGPGTSESLVRKVASYLRDRLHIRVFIVDALPGDGGFGKQTARGLANMAVMLAFCTSTYGEKTASSYCSYYEVERCVDNKIPVIPIKLCQEWPPHPTGDGDEGFCMNQMLFPKAAVYLEWSNKEFDVAACAKEVAQNLRGLADRGIISSEDIFLQAGEASALAGPMGALNVGGHGGAISSSSSRLSEWLTKRSGMGIGQQAEAKRQAEEAKRKAEEEAKAKAQAAAKAQSGGGAASSKDAAAMASVRAEYPDIKDDGSNINDPYPGLDRGLTALHWSAAHGKLDELELVNNLNNLIKLKCNVDVRDIYKGTPLMWAAMRGRVEVVKALVDAGADRSLKDVDGWTALKRAQWYCKDAAKLKKLEDILTKK